MHHTAESGATNISGHFVWSWSQCEGPAQALGSYSTLDKKVKILNDILFVRSKQCCGAGPILTGSEFFFADSGFDPGSGSSLYKKNKL